MIDIVDRLRDDSTRTAWGANVHEQAREAAHEIERLRDVMRWRPASEPPSNSASVLIVDEDGEVDIASWRACKDNLDVHWHYRRGICTEALWWMPLPYVPRP